MKSKDICSTNKWMIGTKLESIEYYFNGSSKVDQIEITAIGRDYVLAVDLETNEEAMWTLTQRDWKEISIN